MAKFRAGASHHPAQLSPNANRLLLALRAGPMASDELIERFWFSPSTHLLPLVRAGLVQRVGLTYHITEAGRSALRPRNPASIRPRNFPSQALNVHGPSRAGGIHRRNLHDT